MQDLYCTGSQKLEALHSGSLKYTARNTIQVPYCFKLSFFFFNLTEKESQTPKFQLQSTASK